MKTVNTLSILWVIIILVAGIQLAKAQDPLTSWCEHMAVMEAARSPQVIVLTHKLKTGTDDEKAHASRMLNALYEEARARGRAQAIARSETNEDRKQRAIDQRMQLEYIRALQMNR